MLGRHCANYNMQDTVLAQLLYHLNIAHKPCCLHPTLVGYDGGPPSPDAGPRLTNYLRMRQHWPNRYAIRI